MLHSIPIKTEIVDSSIVKDNKAQQHGTESFSLSEQIGQICAVRIILKVKWAIKTSDALHQIQP